MAEATENAITQADLDAAVSDASASARGEGVSAERERWASLFASDKVTESSFSLAVHLAGTTSMSVEEIESAISKVPAAPKEESSRNHLEEAMDAAAVETPGAAMEEGSPEGEELSNSEFGKELAKKHGS